MCLQPYLNELQDELFMESSKYLEQILKRICQAKTTNHGKKAREMLRELEHGNRVYALKKALYLSKPGELETRSLTQSKELELNHSTRTHACID